MVPPIGPTFAIAGQVKRPAIFELPADQRPILLEEAMALAGGPVLPGPIRSVRFGIFAEGTEVSAEWGSPGGGIGTTPVRWRRAADFADS